MQLNPSEISELIKARIQGLEGGAEVRNQGTVISVADVDATRHQRYWAEAFNGVVLKMGMLALILGAAE